MGPSAKLSLCVLASYVVSDNSSSVFWVANTFDFYVKIGLGIYYVYISWVSYFPEFSKHAVDFSKFVVFGRFKGD